MTIATGERMYAEDILNLTFFPVGAILIFSGAAYSSASANFRTIWKVCDGTNNTPNLVGRFLRGGTSSDFTTGGGADSRSVTITSANLPAHTHGVGSLAMSALTATELPVSGLAASGFSISGQTISGLQVNTGGGTHSHTISASGTTATTEGGHTHTVSGTTGPDGAHAHDIKTKQDDWNASGGAKGEPSWGSDGGVLSAYKATESAGTHTHDFTGSTSFGEGTHSHSVSVSGTISNDGAHTHTISGGTISGGTITGSITGGTVSGSINAGAISGSTDSAGSGSALTINTLPSYYTVIYIIKIV
ncbi:phage tail fiber protein [Candidatus Termititenax aidoneus]|uniref:Phage tail fiber protein n=1 Tax=Termititenax aidoneus TaxID=2218524 RepID=A0A388TD64_TERA1|nr:phage tail fiber protein [Candidatus Termititenax aidoneus]